MDSETFALRWNNHQSSFTHFLKSARRSGNYCDVTLVCNGNYYRVHKLVLATCSEYFAQMIHKTEDKHPLIVLADLSHGVLEILLDYMYDGQADVHPSDIPALFKAAVNLEIRGLAVTQDALTQDALTQDAVTQDGDSVVGGKRCLENYEDDDIAESKRQKVEDINNILQTASQENHNSTPRSFDLNETSGLLNTLQENNNLPLFFRDVDHSNMIDTSNTGAIGLDFSHDLDAEKLWKKSYFSPTIGVTCPICFKVFKRKKTFIIHIKVHNGEKPYTCPMCPLKFGQRCNLMTHIKKHTGEKPYSCPYCPHQSAQKGNMKAHITNVHAKEEYVKPIESDKASTSPIKHDLSISPTVYPLTNEEQQILGIKFHDIKDVPKEDMSEHPIMNEKHHIPLNKLHDIVEVPEEDMPEHHIINEEQHIPVSKLHDILEVPEEDIPEHPTRKEGQHVPVSKLHDIVKDPEGDIPEHPIMKEEQHVPVSKLHDIAEVPEEDMPDHPIMNEEQHIPVSKLHDILEVPEEDIPEQPIMHEQHHFHVNKLHDIIEVSDEDMSEPEIEKWEPKDYSIEEIQQHEPVLYHSEHGHQDSTGPCQYKSVCQENYTSGANDYKHNLLGQKDDTEHDDFTAYLDKEQFAVSMNNDMLSISNKPEQSSPSIAKDQFSPNYRYTLLQSLINGQPSVHPNQPDINKPEHISPYQNQFDTTQNIYNPFLA